MYPKIQELQAKEQELLAELKLVKFKIELIQKECPHENKKWSSSQDARTGTSDDFARCLDCGHVWWD